MTYFTKTNIENLKTTKALNPGEFYTEMFNNFSDLDFNEKMPLETAIMYLGAYQIDSNLFPKTDCPICGKKEIMIPFACDGSPLSGGHKIFFYCLNCHEQIVFNDKKEYLHLIIDYIQKNKEQLKPSTKYKNCTTIKNANFAIK